MSEKKRLKMVASETTSSAPAALSAAPDPEVRAVAKRRHFSPAYKLSVLEEADRCSNPGEIGALLRREGLPLSEVLSKLRATPQSSASWCSAQRVCSAA
jgi:hypothetical protein